MARSIMSKQVLARKIKALEEIVDNAASAEEEVAAAKTALGELISTVMKMPGGMKLLLQVDALISPEMEEN